MTMLEFRKWLWDEAEEDRWRLSVDGAVRESEFTLDRVQELRETAPEAVYQLAHAEGAGSRELEWILLQAPQPGINSEHLEDLRKWLWQEGKDDHWWLAVGERVVGENRTLDEIAAYQHAHPGNVLLILHKSQENENPTPWVELS